MSDFKSVLKRIKTFLQTDGEKLTDKMLAQKLNLQPEYLSRCKANNHTPYEKVVHFCRENDLDINYILFGKHSQTGSQTVKIKLLNDVYASCGGGGEAVGEEYEWLSLDKTMLDSIFPSLDYKNLESLKAVGDSMEPSIKDGAIVFFDKNDTNIQKTGIFVIRAQGAIFIKRVARAVDGTVELISQNSIYPVQRVAPEDLFVIGRVLGSIERF
jgi:hypothetical protein